MPASLQHQYMKAEIERIQRIQQLGYKIVILVIEIEEIICTLLQATAWKKAVFDCFYLSQLVSM